MAAKKPHLDDPTLKIMERLLSMPPKPHEEMKLGKTKKSGARKQKRTKKRTK